MTRASATPAVDASPARRPRREALLRSGIALAAAIVLGVLGLLAGEQAGDGRAARESRPDGEQAAPPVTRALIAAPQPPQPQPSDAGTSTASAAPSPSLPAGVPPAVAGPAASSPAIEALPATVGAQVAAPPQADSAATRLPQGAEAGVAMAPAAPEASATPQVAVNGVVLPQAALRAGGPGYRIQLGVFGDAGNALKLYNQVLAQGYDGHIQSRVMVGPFADRAAAEKARQALRRAGVGQGVVVLPEQSK